MKQAILALVLASVPTLAAAAPMFTYRFVPSEIIFNPIFVPDDEDGGPYVAPVFEAEITFSRLGPTTAFNHSEFGEPQLGSILDFRINFGHLIHITPETDSRDYHINAAFDVGPQALVGQFWIGNSDATSQWEGQLGVDGVVPGDIWVVSHGTDDPGSGCYGPQNPEGTACLAVGEWVRVRGRGVPEPAAATLLLIGLLGVGAFSVLRHAHRST
jgi:hypothetical protein